MKPVHLAFLGCGFITEVHSRHLRKMRGDFVCSYASRDAARAADFQRRHNGVGHYGSYDEAIRDPAVDAVVVAVPTRYHLELALQALDTGKHVLVEKPAFPQLEDYQTVIEARDQAGCVVIVGENDHYKPLCVELRRLLAEGAIGEMVFGHFVTIMKKPKTADDWRNDEEMAGGDAFFEEGIHWLHIAGSLGPEIRTIHGYRPPLSEHGPLEGDARRKSMLVSFQYDNGAAGALYYSREIPSLFRGLRLSKLFGREGIITFESNGAFLLARGEGLPRFMFPGFRDIRGYRAMYRDFVGAIRDGHTPEMSLERAREDHLLMDAVYASVESRGVRGLVTEQFDVVIIGSGTGGGTVAHTLSQTGARILIIERGDFVPQEEENWSSRAVWGELRYRTTERWLDGRDEEFLPYTHYCVGGNTKFWGAVLYRLRREDFGEMMHPGGVSPAWPITYETLAPYYERAERLYSVHGEVGPDPTEPPREPFPHPPIEHQGRIAVVVERLRALGLHPSHLPLGLLRPGEPDGCILCDTCNSFPCKIRAKSDTDVCAVSPALERDAVTLWTNAYAERLVTNGTGDKVVAAEVMRDGQPVRVEAPLFVVSCGAVNSAALLLRSANDVHRDGLANSSGLVGRNYMAHLATMLGAFMPPRHDTVFQKTVAINDFYLRGPDSDYPLGQIQSQGRSNATIAKAGGPPAARKVPTWAYNAWFSRGVEWLAMSEDLPSPDNRVTVTADGRIRLQWEALNAEAHRELVALAQRLLRKVGAWYVLPISLGVVNTTHQCGTAAFGTDPKTSVLDTWCRSHDVDNLFVVDASFFPSSAAVNPALTIAAQALRAADHIKDTHLT